jgi:magnesium transporter
MSNTLIELSSLLSTTDREMVEKLLYSEEVPSRLITLENSSFLVLRKVVGSEQTLSFTNHFFILTETTIHSIDQDKNTCEKLGSEGTELLRYFQDDIKRTNETIDVFNDHIDQLEDFIFDQEIPRHFIDIWYSLKKSVAKIERFTSRYSKVLQDLGALNYEYSEVLKKTTRQAGQHFSMNISRTNSLVSKLETIYNYYNSFKDEKINKNFYLLTVLSGIFLPLNLIVGFFGMNTENLLFKDNPEGTIYVLYLLLGVLLFFVIGLRLLQLIDSLLLRYGLGHFKMYKTISKKLTKINRVFDLE